MHTHTYIYIHIHMYTYEGVYFIVKSYISIYISAQRMCTHTLDRAYIGIAGEMTLSDFGGTWPWRNEIIAAGGSREQGTQLTKHLKSAGVAVSISWGPFAACVINIRKV